MADIDSKVEAILETPGEVIPNGLGAAAILSCGIGCATFGVLALLGDAFKSVNNALIFYKPSGALSGVSTVAVVVWLVCWFALSRAWGGKTVNLKTINVAAYALLAAALLLTFPPFMDFLQGK